MGAPRALFRCDATPEIGGGHVMRCLTLAHELHRRGAHIGFCVNEDAPRLVPALPRSGYALTFANALGAAAWPSGWSGADMIVADSYLATRDDFTALRGFADALAVIDDVADRAIDADLVINPNPGGLTEHHAGLAPKSARILAGPDYSLVRREFAQVRACALARRRSDPPVRRVLVSLGLTDVGGVTRRCVEGVRTALPGVEIDAVIGPDAPSRDWLEHCAQTDRRLCVTIDAGDMAQRCAHADLAVGAGGGSALERCVTGLPGVVVVVAENQRRAAERLDLAGAAVRLEDGPDLADQVAASLAPLARDAAARRRMAEAAAAICDGEGAGRAADAVLHLANARKEKS